MLWYRIEYLNLYTHKLSQKPKVLLCSFISLLFIFCWLFFLCSSSSFSSSYYFTSAYISLQNLNLIIRLDYESQKQSKYRYVIYCHCIMCIERVCVYNHTTHIYLTATLSSALTQDDEKKKERNDQQRKVRSAKYRNGMANNSSTKWVIEIERKKTPTPTPTTTSQKYTFTQEKCQNIRHKTECVIAFDFNY